MSKQATEMFAVVWIAAIAQPGHVAEGCVRQSRGAAASASSALGRDGVVTTRSSWM
jgi:hypothetical protein